MTDVAESPNGAQPTVEQAAVAADGPAADAPALPAAPAGLPPVAEDRPELAVGAAFAGGFALALLLKRLAR
jgi:hypothetical protein